MVCVIPARGGSKRIPRKNIRDFLGKPIIAYPIQTALDSGLFERVYVSTEDQEIALTAKRWGAEVLERPEELAADNVQDAEVVQHLFDTLDTNVICYLYPTAAMVTTMQLVCAASMSAALQSNVMCIIHGNDAGHFYWYRRNTEWQMAGINNNVYQCQWYDMDLTAIEAQDINTEDDWKLAEVKARLLWGIQ